MNLNWRYHLLLIGLACVAGAWLYAGAGSALGPTAPRSRPLAMPLRRSVPRTPTTPSSNAQGRSGPAAGIVRALVSHLYEENVDYEKRDLALFREARLVPEGEWTVMAEAFAESRLSTDEERCLLYVLGLLGEKGIPALGRVAVAPLPPVSASREAVEISLRLDAWEKLDLLAVNSPAARSVLLALEPVEPNPSVANYAQIARRGVSEGRPGMLHRWLATLERGGRG